MANEILIVVPCYNGEKYLKETLESVHNQTYKNWNLTFIDDFSTDKSQSIYKDFRLEHGYGSEKCSLSIHTKNKGITKSKQYGISMAYYDEFEFFMSLDSDDIIESDYLEKMIPFLRNNPRYDYAYCDTIYFFPNGKEQRFYQPEFNAVKLMQNNFVSYCSVFRTEPIWKTGYDLNNLAKFEDYQLLLRLLRNGSYGIHFPEPLFRYRIHENQSMKSDLIKKFSHLFKHYFVNQIPEMFPENWVNESNEALKRLPDNFMSLKNEELLKILENREI